MAKKKTPAAKSSAAKKKTKKSPTTQKTAKKPPKQHAHDQHDENEIEIELDATECEAVDLVLDSDDLRLALETEVNRVVSQAVRKLCKAHGVALTAAQAQNVAMTLFGD